MRLQLRTEPVAEDGSVFTAAKTKGNKPRTQNYCAEFALNRLYV